VFDRCSDLPKRVFSLTRTLAMLVLPVAAVAAAPNLQTDLQTDLRLLGQSSASYDSANPAEIRFVDLRAAGSLAAGTLQPGNVVSRQGGGSFSRLAAPPEGCEGCGSIAVVGAGSGQVLARAAYGALGVSATSSLDASWAFPQGAYFADAGLSATATSRFIDKLAVLSTSQPAGAPVQLALDSHLHMTLSMSGLYTFLVSGNPAVSVRYQLDVLRAGAVLSLPSFSASYSQVEFSTGLPAPSLRHLVDVQVGDVLTVDVSFAAQAGLFTGDGFGGAGGSGLINATGTAEAMNSLDTRIDVLSAGVALQSASGHNYLASPVPEPSTAWLWLCALAGLALRWCGRAWPRVGPAMLLCWAPWASAQLQFDLPAPQLQLALGLSASAGSIGPSEDFDASLYLRSDAVGTGVLMPAEVYSLQRAGSLNQSHSFEGTEDDPGTASGYADLRYSGTAAGRAGFGNLGVAVALAQSGSGFWFASSPSGISSGMGSGESSAESRVTAIDSFAVLSAGRALGAEVMVDFNIDVSGSVRSAAVSDGSSPAAIGSLGVLRHVTVWRPGFVLPVLDAGRDFWWQAGHDELGPSAQAHDRLTWQLPLQVGDQVAIAISLVASVTNHSGVPPGGDAAFAGLFDASGRVDAMQSAHASLVAGAADVQLLAASGHVYSASPVPEPSTAWLWSSALVVLVLRRSGLQMRDLPRLQCWWPGLVAAGLSVLNRSP
jgi:hypothetical protein